MSALGSKVEMADLMEASFWDEHKAKIGSAIALVVGAVLVWQWIETRRESTESAGWAEIYDSRFDVRADVDLNGAIASTAAAPWALYHSAVKAFGAEDYARAETLIQQLRASPGFAIVNQDRRVDSLADDVAAEKAFRAANPMPKTAPQGSDRTLTLSTEVGEIQIALYSDAPKSAVLKLLEAERAAKLKDVAIDVTDEPGEVVFPFGELPAESTLASILDAADLEVLRREGEHSNLAGSVSIRLLDGDDASETPAADAKPHSLAVSIALADQPDHGEASIVIGVLNKGLSELSEVAKRKPNDKGRLEAPLKITGIVESPTLAEVK